MEVQRTGVLSNVYAAGRTPTSMANSLGKSVNSSHKELPSARTILAPFAHGGNIILAIARNLPAKNSERGDNEKTNFATELTLLSFVPTIGPLPCRAALPRIP